MIMDIQTYLLWTLVCKISTLLHEFRDGVNSSSPALAVEICQTEQTPSSSKPESATSEPLLALYSHFRECMEGVAVQGTIGMQYCRDDVQARS